MSKLTKPEIIAKLTELGVTHDPESSKSVLEGLLPKSENSDQAADDSFLTISDDDSPEKKEYLTIVSKFKEQNPNGYTTRRAEFQTHAATL